MTCVLFPGRRPEFPQSIKHTNGEYRLGQGSGIQIQIGGRQRVGGGIWHSLTFGVAYSKLPPAADASAGASESLPQAAPPRQPAAGIPPSRPAPPPPAVRTGAASLPSAARPPSPEGPRSSRAGPPPPPPAASPRPARPPSPARGSDSRRWRRLRSGRRSLRGRRGGGHDALPVAAVVVEDAADDQHGAAVAAERHRRGCQRRGSVGVPGHADSHLTMVKWKLEGPWSNGNRVAPGGPAYLPPPGGHRAAVRSADACLSGFGFRRRGLRWPPKTRGLRRLDCAEHAFAAGSAVMGIRVPASETTRAPDAPAPGARVGCR